MSRVISSTMFLIGFLGSLIAEPSMKSGDATLLHFQGYAHDANNNPTSAYQVYVKLGNQVVGGPVTPNSSGYWEVRYDCPNRSDTYYTLELGSPAVGALGHVPHFGDSAPCDPHSPTTRTLKVGEFLDE